MDNTPVKSYESYKRIKQLGSGAYGQAFLVQCESDKSLCVIKQIDLEDLNDDDKKAALREAKILELLQHDNIIDFKEVYKTNKGKLCIVMGYADDGDVQKKVEDQKQLKDSNNNSVFWTED